MRRSGVRIPSAPPPEDPVPPAETVSSSVRLPDSRVVLLRTCSPCVPPPVQPAPSSRRPRRRGSAGTSPRHTGAHTTGTAIRANMAASLVPRSLTIGLSAHAARVMERRSSPALVRGGHRMTASYTWDVFSTLGVLRVLRVQRARRRLEQAGVGALAY